MLEMKLIFTDWETSSRTGSTTTTSSSTGSRYTSPSGSSSSSSSYFTASEDSGNINTFFSNTGNIPFSGFGRIHTPSGNTPSHFSGEGLDYGNRNDEFDQDEADTGGGNIGDTGAAMGNMDGEVEQESGT